MIVTTKFEFRLYFMHHVIITITVDYTSCHHNVYKKSIAYGQAVRFKRIFSAQENLNNRLEQLRQWLENCG